MPLLNRTRLFLAVTVLVAIVYFAILGRLFDTLGVPRPAAPNWRPAPASKETAYANHLGAPHPKKPRPRPKGKDAAVGMPDRLERLESVLDVTFGEACAGWNPHGAEADDPPNCLRAKQFREIQAFKKIGFNWEAFHVEAQKEAIKHLELCVLGYRVCPERPLIIADYWFAFTAKTGLSGECIWLEPVVDTAMALGFAYFPANMFKTPQNWNLTRMFTHSLHMYWPQDSHGYQCLTNPRCVRPEDYNPAADPKHRWDVSRIPKHEIGTLPAWRVFLPTYWGTRPDAIGYPGTSPALFWGQGKADKWQEWSLHILGQKWQFTPYPYPGHTWLPLTVEQSCLAAPTKPWKDRPNHVLILAKSASYFHEYSAGEWLLPQWPKIIKALDEWGIKLVTTAKVDDPKKPVPEGMIQVGPQSKYDYEKLLANSKALMGIGRPEISPSPYNALCAGVPVVMPYYGKHMRGEGWQRYNQNHHQHGPVNDLPEPYSYPYNMSDMDDLVNKLRKAVNHPIESFIPEEMRLKNTRDKATEFLLHDWEGEYHKVLATTGGRIAEYDPAMLEACMATGWCVDPGTQGEGEHGIMRVH